MDHQRRKKRKRERAGGQQRVGREVNELRFGRLSLKYLQKHPLKKPRKHLDLGVWLSEDRASL